MSNFTAQLNDIISAMAGKYNALVGRVGILENQWRLINHNGTAANLATRALFSNRHLWKITDLTNNQTAFSYNNPNISINDAMASTNLIWGA